MYREKYDLSGRVAVITGGAGGIGLECARALGECGAQVVVADVRDEAGREAERGLREAGHAAEYARPDVTDSAAVATCALALAERLGRVDVLVNCAGIGANTYASDITDDEWARIIDVNLNGLFWCSRAFGALMLAQGGGAIVNIGSFAGLIANRPQSHAHYSASKAGVHMVTKSLAGEWAPKGVRVNAVAPGFIDTPMSHRSMVNADWLASWLEAVPMGRLGRPDEIASAVLFLASDALSLMTGAVLVADGGYTVW